MEEIVVNPPAGGENKDGLNLQEMMEAGLHFGHKTSRTHPKMKPYITGVRNAVHIINLEKTREKLKEALDALQEMVASGKTVILVGTRVQTKALVREVAEECNVAYVTERWIGGSLTNFEEVSKRVAYLKELEDKLASKEESSKYTKWERHEMQEDIKKLERKFGGVRNLEKVPSAMVVFDLDDNQIAVREAKQKGITIFAISDTNSDPTSVEYAIPANDDAVSSLRYITTKIKEAILEGQKLAPLRVEQAENGDNRPS